MIRTVLLSATVAAFGFAFPAFADGYFYRHGPNGGYAEGSRHVAPGQAFRSFSAQGVRGGAATLDGSCVRGVGCSREWSRTLRNGATASGSVAAQRGVGISRSGVGFRGRTW